MNDDSIILDSFGNLRWLNQIKNEAIDDWNVALVVRYALTNMASVL